MSTTRNGSRRELSTDVQSATGPSSQDHFDPSLRKAWAALVLPFPGKTPCPLLTAGTHGATPPAPVMCPPLAHVSLQGLWRMAAAPPHPSQSTGGTRAAVSMSSPDGADPSLAGRGAFSHSSVPPGLQLSHGRGCRCSFSQEQLLPGWSWVIFLLEQTSCSRRKRRNICTLQHLQQFSW